MRKVLAIGFVAASFASVMGVAVAEPGPNGNNNHGLCTAFFNGQKNGHGRPEDGGTAPPPFQSLYETAQEDAPRNNDDDPDNDVSGIDAVINYCLQYGIQGNPDHGRYGDELEAYQEANPDETNNRRGGGNGNK